MRRTLLLVLGFLITCVAPAEAQEARQDSEGLNQQSGRFLREYWYEPGLEHGNPFFNRRFRVNAPEAVIHPTFSKRSEVRSSGMLQILVEEDLLLLAGAELYLELWGGHPGTASKRVGINGRSLYPIPEVGAAAKHCTHEYPLIPLKVTDLVNGYNALQFACDQGTTFWGHFIVDNAAIRVELTHQHPALLEVDLADFIAEVQARPNPDRERIDLTLAVDTGHHDQIASVHYQGFYVGYDENGSGRKLDWHGFTKDREPVAWIGSSAEPPFRVTWDLSMLPEQEEMAVRAFVRFHQPANLVYSTPSAGGLGVRERSGAQVTLHLPSELPAPFWSRAGRTHRATIELDIEPSRIERAELHIVTWDGGRGTVEDYFTLNGHALPVAGSGRHDVIYSRLKLDAGILRKGRNEFVLLSDTQHHGIEVLLPGPALMIRSESP